MLDKFINPQQLTLLHELSEESEEAQFFKDKLQEITALINRMPVTYETEQTDNPIAQLHYFLGSIDVYITERDVNPEQNQAFGYVNLGYGFEAGYVSIPELLESKLELDLYFARTTINTLIK